MEIHDAAPLRDDGQSVDHHDGPPAAADIDASAGRRISCAVKSRSRRRGPWTKAAVATGTAAALVGALALLEAGLTHSGPTAPAAAHTTSSAGSVSLAAADLADPGRLKSALARLGVPADVEVLHARVVDGVALAGCSGPDQQGLAQISAVVGQLPPPPGSHTPGGVSIRRSAMPRGTVLAFDYWVLPGSTRPTNLPLISLHQGAPPPCSPPTGIPQALASSAGTLHQVP